MDLRTIARNSFIFTSLVLLAACSVSAQYFGKNKIQYSQFDWSYIKTDHFDIYFYEDGRELATFVAEESEAAYAQLSEDLNYKLRNRVPVLLFNSHHDFEQTNVITEMIEEGVAGFTEYFKNRVVIHFDGSYEAFRHLIHHELTHAVTYDMVRGGVLESLASSQFLFNLPLWVPEGMAEYSSSGWDTEADMYMRDATIQGYIPPLENGLYGFMAYKGGQSIFRYIANRYSPRKIGEILSKIRLERNLDKALQSAIGVDTKELGRVWMLQLKKEYWPEVAQREEPRDFAKGLTDHRKDGSYFNRSPALSPKGDEIIFISDRTDYTSIYLMSAIDGKIFKRLIRGERSAGFEELHIMNAGLSWAPDGERFIMSAKSGDQDALYIVNVKSGDIEEKIVLDFERMRSPSWSPAEDKIAFVGIQKGMADIYTYDIHSKDMRQLLSDVHDDIDPRWSPTGERIAFSSDRSSLAEKAQGDETFAYGQYDIFTIAADGSNLTRITDHPAIDISPAWSPDGRQLVFVSDRTGISNLYIADLDSQTTYPITNVIGGCFSPDWSTDGKRIVFTTYHRAGWDIYVMKDPLSHRKDPGSIPLTPFAAGEEPALTLAVSDRDSLAPVEERQHPDFTNYIFAPGREEPRAEAEPEEADTVGEQVSFRLPNGEYREFKYKLKFTPDIVTGSVGYNTHWGFTGQTLISLSDIMGNHRFLIYTDLFYSLQNSNFQLVYFYLPKRIDVGAGIFHFRNYYYIYQNELWFSDRTYGATLLASYPFSKFRRLDLDLLYIGVQREYINFDDFYYYYSIQKPDGLNTLSTSLSLTDDTVIWGYTGPVNGSRSQLTVQYVPDIGLNSLSFVTAVGDYRRYYRIQKKYNLVLRLVSGFSDGVNPRLFFLGGMTNWAWPSYARTDVFEAEGFQDFYFAGFQTPLRGYRYYEIAGTRFALANMEFRFPLVQRLLLGWPLPLSFGEVRGAFFFDVGGAWYSNKDFKPFARNDVFPRLEDLNAGYGIGARMGFLFALLKFDIAWKTDLTKSGSPGEPTYYLSLGSEF